MENTNTNLLNLMQKSFKYYTEVKAFPFLETMDLEEKLNYLYFICSHLCYKYDEEDNRPLFENSYQKLVAWQVVDGNVSTIVYYNLDDNMQTTENLNREQVEKDIDTSIQVFSNLLKPVEPEILVTLLKGVLSKELYES